MDELLSAASVPAIAAAVYWVVNLIKYTTNHNEKVLTFVPVISAFLGVVFGLVAFFLIPETMPTTNFVTAIVIGGASGLTATGFNQVVKQIGKNNGDGKE
jgi:flagellar biosynthesis protein FliQ